MKFAVATGTSRNNPVVLCPRHLLHSVRLSALMLHMLHKSGQSHHAGEHNILLCDWEQFKNLADRHWGQPQ